MKSNSFHIIKRETKKGIVYDVRFRIMTRDGEKYKRLSGFATKKEASKSAMEYIAGYKPPTKAELEIGVVRYEVARDAYFKYLDTSVAKSTAYEMMFAFPNHIDDYFKGRDLSKVTKSDCLKWQDELWAKRKPNGKPYAYATLRYIRSITSTFFNWCVFRYEIENPFAKIKIPKKQTIDKPMEIWTREEFDKFISCVDNQIFKVFFSILFFTGMRLGECIALTPADIKNNNIYINKTYSSQIADKVYDILPRKNKKAIVVPVCPVLAPLLDEYVKTIKGEFLFYNERPVSQNLVHRRFAKYIQESGVKRIRIHDLRHSFVSMIVHNGANYVVVADLIGDTTAQVLKTYAHMWDSDKQDVMSRIV